MVYRYFNNCVSWEPPDVDAEGGLSDLIDQRVTITRRTFIGKVEPLDRVQLEESLGYARHPKQGLTMAADWAVEYFKSKLHSEVVYGLRWSGIEYVFKLGNPVSVYAEEE